MHLNTAVVKHILPKLEKYEGMPLAEIPFAQIALDIMTETGKGVNFNVITDNADRLLRLDMANSKTVSFNIIIGDDCMQELNSSSAARRNRFRHLVSNRQVVPDHRAGMILHEISGKKCFTINIVERYNQAHFSSIFGFYGTSINGWYERFNVGETVAEHSIPSTHFMPRENAADTIFLIEKIVKLKVAK